MSVRTQEFVRGNETTLAVNKTDAEPASMVTLQCATSISYKTSIELQSFTCYGGESQLPSGKKPVAALTVNGNVKEYSTANQANNVSAREMETWHRDKARKLWAYSRPHDGDTIRTGYGYVTEFGEEGSAEGTPQTWSATIAFEGDVEITTVSA